METGVADTRGHSYEKRGIGVDNDWETEADVAIRRLCIKGSSFWCWDEQDKSCDALLGGVNNSMVTFHPHWSNGTGGVRASLPVIRDGISFWEVKADRVFGTAVMFGVSTKEARLHVNDFKHLLGDDENGWGLSHDGCLYHNGVSSRYCPPFGEFTPATVGVLLDMPKGEMTFYKNGQSLGVAFAGLQHIQADLYPTVCSTAVRTSMTVGRRLKSMADLKDSCRHVITSAILSVSCDSNEKFVKNVNTLPVPDRVKKYLCAFHNTANRFDCKTAL